MLKALPTCYALTIEVAEPTYTLPQETWARPSWLSSAGLVALVEGNYLSPYENLASSIVEKGHTLGYPCRAVLAEMEIEPLIEKLGETCRWGLSIQVHDNLKDILSG